jgi:hypothetical protein
MNSDVDNAGDKRVETPEKETNRETVSRRNVLLAGSTLVAVAAALHSGSKTEDVVSEFRPRRVAENLPARFS